VASQVKRAVATTPGNRHELASLAHTLGHRSICCVLAILPNGEPTKNGPCDMTSHFIEPEGFHRKSPKEAGSWPDGNHALTFPASRLSMDR
jgi:hypothetical protein